MQRYILPATVLAIIFCLTPERPVYAQAVHWDLVVGQGDSCRYTVPVDNTGGDWTGVGFDDSGWLAGPGGVGYGDGDDGTGIEPALSVYCRYRFRLNSDDFTGDLILLVDYDDGFAAYLNGMEVARANLGEPGTQITWDQTADGNHEAQIYQGNQPAQFILGPEVTKLLNQNVNVLSIRAHNRDAGSSDMTSNLWLIAGTTDTSGTWRDPPEWFRAPYIFQGGKLPLMVISTGGAEIPDEPRITARMGLIYKGTEEINRPTDPFNVYDGQISIETRGESSLGIYEKKSYSIETQTDSGANFNVSLLGLPEENDYVLYGPYGDKSLIRNVICYGLFSNMGHYAPRTRFIELFVDSDYRGLYVLTEKIKRDRNRVDIPGLNQLDTGSVDRTGGYILRVDKTTRLDPSAYWESDVSPPVSGHHRTQFQFFDPEYDELTMDQQEYIRGWLHDFEAALASSSFRDPVSGYRAYLDIPSFIDLMVLNEFTKDVDAYGYSHYFYKERDDRGGRLFQGPPWDYNLTFGNVDFAGDVQYPEEWVYNKGKAVFWWDRVMQDPWFTHQLYCRWDQLHGSLIRTDLLEQQIDQLEETLGEAINRNFERWPVLGVYIWPNAFVAEDYGQEIRFLKTWIGSRIDWLDGQWGGRCIASADFTVEVPDRGSLRIYPNPSDFSQTRILLPEPDPGPVEVRISNLAGQPVFLSREYPEGETLRLPDLRYLPAGIYILVVKAGGHSWQDRLLKI